MITLKMRLPRHSCKSVTMHWTLTQPSVLGTQSRIPRSLALPELSVRANAVFSKERQQLVTGWENCEK